jgi:hypothetical protein
MERLKFDPSWLISGVVADPVPVVALHEIENALSALAATILWTGVFRISGVYSIMIMC